MSKNVNKKKILIFAHYYYPDVASTGQILQDQAEGMLNDFDVTVICVVPSYTGKVDAKYRDKKYYYENINGVKVIRVRVPDFTKTNKLSRSKNIITYFVRAVIAAMKSGKQDYVFTISQPPILGGLLGVCGKVLKRAKMIYCIQDFNPEQIMAIEYSKNKLILWAMMVADKISCRSSDLVITVGRDLCKTLENRFKNKKTPNYTMINNWIDEKEIYPLDSNNEKVLAFKRKYNIDNKFVIMYSGNIGLYYDLINLMKVIEKFKPGTKTPDGREVVFAFVGAGSILEHLKNYVNEHNMTNVVFIPYQDKADLIYSLNGADVHWCVNAKGIKGVSCPSKFYGICGARKPVLAVLERDSEIEMLINETSCGLVSEPGDYDAVQKNIQWFIDHANNHILDEMSQRGYEYLIENMTKDISIRKYIEAIKAL